MNYFTLFFALLNVAAVTVYTVDSTRRDNTRGLSPLIASVAAGAAIIVLLSELGNETVMFFALSFALLFSMLPFYYTMKTRKMLALLGLAVLQFFYATYSYGSLLYPFIQMFAVGTAFGVYYKLGKESFNYRHERDSKSVETKRDVIHILLGTVILALFMVLPFYYAIYATFTLILIGYVYNSILGKNKRGKLFSFLNSLERPNSLYGLGALYLGVGTAFLIGFIHNFHFLIIGTTALFLADPIATIVGMNLKGPKLPYNKNKSVYGTLSFFLVVSLIGYPFIGSYSLLFGLGLAFVESVRSLIDDNISISVSMIILYILFLSLVHQLPF